MATGGNHVMWFRKGLRMHDNPAFLEAIRDAQHLYPVFVLDPWFLKPERCVYLRRRCLRGILVAYSHMFASQNGRLATYILLIACIIPQCSGYLINPPFPTHTTTGHSQCGCESYAIPVREPP